MRKVWAAVIVASVAASCGKGQGGPINAAFDASSAAYVLKPGKGQIDGQAFLKRDYGRLVTAAGERVFLVPATAYAVERFSQMFGGENRAYYGNDVSPPPEEYYRFRRETKVDMSGRFTFEKLAAGRYIVATRIFWTEPKSFLTHGGAVYDIVEVKDDETTTAIISGK